MEGINLVGTEVVRNRKGKLRLQMMKLKMPRLIFSRCSIHRLDSSPVFDPSIKCLRGVKARSLYSDSDRAFSNRDVAFLLPYCTFVVLSDSL